MQIHAFFTAVLEVAVLVAHFLTKSLEALWLTSLLLYWRLLKQRLLRLEGKGYRVWKI